MIEDRGGSSIRDLGGPCLWFSIKNRLKTTKVNTSKISLDLFEQAAHACVLPIFFHFTVLQLFTLQQPLCFPGFQCFFSSKLLQQITSIGIFSSVGHLPCLKPSPFFIQCTHFLGQTTYIFVGRPKYTPSAAPLSILLESIKNSSKSRVPDPSAKGNAKKNMWDEHMQHATCNQSPH